MEYTGVDVRLILSSQNWGPVSIFVDTYLKNSLWPTGVRTQLTPHLHNQLVLFTSPVTKTESSRVRLAGHVACKMEMS